MYISEQKWCVQASNGGDIGDRYGVREECREMVCGRGLECLCVYQCLRTKRVDGCMDDTCR